MGLDQLRLLRSQHKMARLLLVAALCLASVKAAVIPVEEIVDNLQSFLTAPEESGLRLKRSTGEWDKEFDLSSMGILFQLKYNNPANPFEGGRAHVKVPGARFIRNAPFDDMDLDIEFNGGSAIDGLFDMKVDYKFIQKFMFLADRPQEGSFVLYRKMEGGMWKTKVTVDNNNMIPKPFLEDNKWELKVDRVQGQKMTIEATINGKKWTGVGNLNQGEMKLNLKMDSEFTGKHYTLDFDLNPSGMWGIHITGDVDGPVDAKWTMQKDYTMGEIVVKYKNQNYAFMQLKGNAEMRGVFPVVFDYVVKYNIKDAMEYQGKAKMKFDGKTPAKKFEMSFAPKTGTPMDLIWNMDFSSGFKYDYDFKMTMTEESPFYGMVYWYTGRYGKNVERKMTVFFDKINKSILFVPKMKMDTTLTLDGEKISEFVFDNTQAKKHIKFFYSPDAYTKDYLFTDEWEYPGHSGCKWNTELKRGDVSIWNWVGDYSFVNNANKFEIKTMDKIVQTEMSPFYGLDHFYLGRYYKNGGRSRTITYDKQNRNFLLGKLFVENTITLDGEKFSQEKLDTRSTPYTMVWFSQPVRGLFPITRDITGQDEMIVSAWHTPGKELKIETNLPEVQSLKVTSAGPTKK